MAGSAAPEWATWQLLDSLLPTGAFAHSLGLEAALRQGWLGGEAGAPGVFPFGPPAPACSSSVPYGGEAPQGSSGVPVASGRASDSGLAVRVFALSAMANVASQLLPFCGGSTCLHDRGGCWGPWRAPSSRGGGRGR